MEPVHDLILRRRSGRAIDPDRPVEEAKILSLLEAARWAPSCFNNQPWRIIVSKDSSLNSVKACFSKGNAWARRAPLILAMASKPDLDCQITGRDYYPLGIGLAVENLLLQAIHLGFVVHPIAGFDEIKIKEVLHIPDAYRVHTLVIVGYPGSLEGLDDWVLEKERTPRERKPVEEIVFWEGWEKPKLE
jgi:nitroreductase